MIGQISEKSPGDLRRLAVFQTPVKKPSANVGMKNSQGRDMTGGQGDPLGDVQEI